jgi:membrane-associated protease RseP (regulator of RpoE activity)
MGAVIRVRSPFPSRKALFDVGIAGPIAGFLVTLVFLIIGFWTLPGKEHLYLIHPEYALTGEIPQKGFAFGGSILFSSLAKLFALHTYVPPMTEIYHYPLLCVGWFGLFVTALNLLPVGQLDGGHILYALLGAKAQSRIGRIFWGLLVLAGLTGALPFLGVQVQLGTLGWLLWAAILFFIIKLDHPPLLFDDPLTPGRRMLGWASILIFLVSFPPVPFYE